MQRCAHIMQAGFEDKNLFFNDKIKVAKNIYKEVQYVYIQIGVCQSDRAIH